ncbi:MAG: PBP1A family penicillin-binding protein [Actinobacteria bacterium]|nr:PBP1A family penicillin-binding protein [Actinomycetota bacterium]
MRSFTQKKPARKRRRIRKLRLLGLVIVLGVLSCVSFSFGLVRAIASEIPKLDPQRQLDQQVNGYIYDSNRRSPRVLAVLRGSEARTLVKYEEIADSMRHAIVAVEDRRFWEHDGIDLRGIGRALVADIRHKKVVEGGSTITQQFVKNALDRDQRTIARKVREAALAWQLERDRGGWSKQRILTAYLNTIYFGNGAYGVQQAARTYFQHGAQELTIPEAALLAGIPADPSRYDPVANPQAAMARRRTVLRAMLEEAKITPAQYAEAVAVPLPEPENVRLPGTEGPAQYFVNYVKQQLIAHYGSAEVFGGGLRVTTTIDLELQDAARKAISKWLTDPEGPSAALVAIDPRNGAVRAMVGGNNYRESQFNLAVQGERQPGSAFKPFVLATALRQGISPVTRFASEPQTIDLGDKFWAVSNYDDVYFGSLDLEQATIESDNTVYAQLTQLVGSKKVAETARRLGIRSELEGFYAIGLGVEAVNPLELARAYAAFANGGWRIDGAMVGDLPRVFEKVNENGRRTLFNARVKKRVLSPTQVAILNSILQKAVSQGTGTRAQLPDRPVAGKTGTTENYADAWFVGYTPQLAVAIWVGYPESPKPMLTEFRGEPVTGGSFPALIWKSFAERALRDKAPQYFPEPLMPYGTPKIVVRRGDRVLVDNGLCRSRHEVIYFSGAGPTGTANCLEDEVAVPDVRGLPLAEAEARVEAQPLTPKLIYAPARPLQRPGVVVDQDPARGYRSSYATLTLVVSKPTHGVIPDLVGTRLAKALLKLRKLKLEPHVTWSAGKPGTVLKQKPAPGLAAAPGLKVELVAARGAARTAAGG